MNLKMKENSSTVVLLCLLVIAVLIYFVFRPLVTGLNSANVDLKTSKSELEQKEEKLENLQNLKSKIASYRETLSVMQKALPKGEDLPSLLVSTESLVGSSGLGLSSFSPSGVGEKSTGTSATSASTSTSAASSSGVTTGEETTSNAVSEPTSAVSSKVTEQTGVASSAFSLSLTGGYAAFLIFMDNVNKNIRPTVINSIDIGGTGDNLNINLQLSTYYQK